MATPKRIPKRLVKVGMKVTCRKTAYVNTECSIEPGEIGIVMAVDCPCVTYHYRFNGGTATFVSAEFTKRGRKWRCALYYNNLKVLYEKKI